MDGETREGGWEGRRTFGIQMRIYAAIVHILTLQLELTWIPLVHGEMETVYRPDLALPRLYDVAPTSM